MAHDEKWFRGHVVDGAKTVGYAEIMGSMTKNGIADVYVAHRSAAMWLELKFVELPPLRHDSNALGHPFTGPQRRFLRDVTLNGGLAFGLVGMQMRDGIRVSLHTYEEIDEKGQLTLGQLQDARHYTLFEKRSISDNARMGAWLAEQTLREESLRRHRQPVPAYEEPKKIKD